MSKQQIITFRHIADRVARRLLKFQIPVLEEYRVMLKWPANAKFVVLSQNNPLIENLMKRQFQSFGNVNGNEYKDNQTQTIAERVQEVSAKNVGALLYNYPNNAEQAKELDILLDGVNIALNFKVSESLQKKIQDSYTSCQSCGQVFNTKLQFISPVERGFELNEQCDSESKCYIQPTNVNTSDVSNPEVQNYYNERGLLFNFEITEDHLLLNQKEFHQTLSDALLSAIKL